MQKIRKEKRDENREERRGEKREREERGRGQRRPHAVLGQCCIVHMCGCACMPVLVEIGSTKRVAVQV